MPPAPGSRSCGPTASISPPRSCSSSRAAGVSTPTLSGTTSSAPWAAEAGRARGSLRREHTHEHAAPAGPVELGEVHALPRAQLQAAVRQRHGDAAVSYTHLRAHETVLDLVCRLLLEKKKTQ